MTLLVALVALAVFIAFAYNYMQESRLPELLERHQLHPPLSPRTLREIDDRFHKLNRGIAREHLATESTDPTSGGSADEPVGKSG